MSAMKLRTILLASAAVLLADAAWAVMGSPTVGTGIDNARYATDAYPGFDVEDDNVKPERKEPKWLAFVFGPNRENAADQYAYCQELVAAEDFKKAARQLDALVREWPTAPEACKAQQQLAEILLNRLQDSEEAFREYRYLLDFYSSQCNYGAVADRLYQVAGIRKLEGKELMFVRFANTVDVRRDYEACVLRAPGAKWVPDALMTIAALRVDEGKPAEAVKVYENLRNLYPETEQAKAAIAGEADVRMDILRDCEYNRARCRDTVDFLMMALRSCRPADSARLREYLDEAKGLMEAEAYRSAKFYDSKTRTTRSAVSAYERFLAEYPDSVHADEIKTRIEVLKGEAK